jgi:hypothetical protein
MKKSFFSLLIVFSLFSVRLFSQCYIPITSTSDSGPGSLRQAIISANACLGTPVITFEIPSSAVIELLSDLPVLNYASLTIDGSVAPGYSYPDALVTINWSGRDDCLELNQDNVTIRGIAFTNNFNGSGYAAIRASGGNNLLVEYCCAYNQNRHFVYSNEGTEIRLENCTAEDFSNDGSATVFSCYDNGGFSLISYCNIRNIASRSIDISNSGAPVTTIEENVFTNVGYEDNSSLGGRGQHIVNCESAATRLTIRNNIIIGCKSKFVNISRGSTFLTTRDSIFNNSVVNCTGKHVIYIEGMASSFAYIAENNIAGDGGVYNMDQVIELNGAQYGKIKGNVIKNSKSRGIMAKNSDGTIIKDNIMYNLSNSSNIELNDDCDNVIIRGNILGTDSLNTPGLSLATDATIRLNDCDNCYVGGDVSLNLGNQIIAAVNKSALTVANSCEGTTTIQGNDFNISSDGLTNLTASNSAVLAVYPANAIIGGESELYRNRISGLGTGIQLDGQNAAIQGNFIGCTRFGSPVAGSAMPYGIYVNANNTTIGSKTTVALRNKIGYCEEAIRNNDKDNVLWSGNEFYKNTATVVVNNVGSSPNGGILPPVISGGTLPSTVFGNSQPNARVEVYHQNPATSVQGYQYLGFATANASGAWTFTSPVALNDQVAALQIDNLNASEFATYTSLPIQAPTANFDYSPANVVGTNAVINILNNDLLSNGNPAIAALVSVDLDLSISGIQTTLTAGGEGTWTYNSSNGNLTFDPQAGFTRDPSIIQYKLIQNSNGYSDLAVVWVGYTEIPPIANDDASNGNLTGWNTIINILSNDLLSDGSSASAANVSVDINSAIPGIQTILTIPGQGIWIYNVLTGELTFDPQTGFSLNPPVLKYILIETITGYTDMAEVTVTYIPPPPPVANDDVSSGHFFGTIAEVQIMANDHLSDGSVPLPGLVLIDIDQAIPGIQIKLIVPNEGVWNYYFLTGILSFDPVAGFLSNPSVINYTLTENSTGFSDGASVTLNYSLGTDLFPPLNLKAGVRNNNDVQLFWEPPVGFPGQYIQWDNGANFEGIGLTSGGTFSVAAHWKPSQLTQYDTWLLTHVQLFPRDVSQIVFTLKVWSGAGGSTLLYSQPLNNLVPNQWNTIILDTPVEIISLQDLWVGYSVENHPAGTYPAGCDEGPAQPGHGDMIRLDGANWKDLKDFGYNYNWNIHAGIEPAGEYKVLAQTFDKELSLETNASDQISRSFIVSDDGKNAGIRANVIEYNIFRNEEFLTSVPGNKTTCFDNNLPVGVYSYKISANYTGGESLPAGPIEISIPGGTGPVIVLNTNPIEETHLMPPQSSSLPFSITNTGSSMLDFNVKVLPPENRKSIKLRKNNDTKSIPATRTENTKSPLWKSIKTESNIPTPVRSNEVIIRYDNGVNYGALGLSDPGGTFEVAAYFPASTMANYTGMLLKQMDVFIFHVPTTFKIKVYSEGTATQPGDLIYEQEVGEVPAGDVWSLITLNDEIPITGDDLWIGYEVSHGPGVMPASYDNGPAVAGFGDWVYTDGVWSSMTDFGFDLNWNIAGYLFAPSPDYTWVQAVPVHGSVSPDETFNMELTFDSENLSIGIHEAILQFNSNDPANPAVDIPVSLNVGGVVLDPPVNLAATVTGNDVSLTWYVPVNDSKSSKIKGSRALLGYKIYREGLFLEQVAETSYTDENLISGTYEYYVKAVYDLGSSPPSDTAEAIILPSGSDPHILVSPGQLYEAHFSPPQTTFRQITISNAGEIPLDFNIDVVIDSKKIPVTGFIPKLTSESFSDKNTGKILLTKGNAYPGEYPSKQKDEEVIRYDNGENFSWVGLSNGGTFQAATYFPYSTIWQYTGMEISQIEFFIKEAITDCRIQVFGQGSASIPGPLLYEEVVEVTPDSWNLIELSTPVIISEGDLWIGYQVTHDAGFYPGGIDAGPAVAGFGDMVNFSGSWATLSGYGINNNWNIAGYLTGTPFFTWLKTDTTSGTINQNQSQTINISINSLGLSQGIHEASLILTSNDPLTPEVIVPVTLNVGTTELNPPQNLQANLISLNDVLLTWDNPSKSSSINSGNNKNFPASGKSESLASFPNDKQRGFLGYNVYRDGVIINNNAVLETSYTDTDLAIGTYNYEVTALYVEGESLPSVPVQIIIPSGAEITIDPTFMEETHTTPPQITTQQLLVTNTGTSILNFNLEVLIGKGSAIPEPEPGLRTSWLSAQPLTGNLNPGLSATITVIYNSADLSFGVYNGTLHFTSNDPVNPVVNIPVTLNVTTEELNPPQNLQAEVINSNDVLLTWESPAIRPAKKSGNSDFGIGKGFLGYNVYRDGVVINQNPIQETTFIDSALENGFYTYDVTAAYDEGESPGAGAVEVMIGCPLPPPQNLLAQDTGPEEVYLTWEEPEIPVIMSQPDRDLLGYNVYRDSLKINESLVTLTEYYDTSVPAGYHEYYVTASYSQCESEPSNTATIIVGFSELSQENMSLVILPNPAATQVDFASNSKMIRITIKNSIGKNFYKEAINQSKFQLDVSSFPKGLYLVEIEFGEGRVIKKLVIK